MITARTLKSPEDLRRFAAGYVAAYAGKKLQSLHSPRAEDLARYDHVIGVFRGGEMIAGFIVNRYPHRCLETVPVPRRREIERRLGGAQNMSELAAIWRSSVLSSVFFAERVWPIIVHRAWRLGRKYIFGCVYRGHGMSRKYLVLRPTVVQRGRYENDLTVFYYTRFSLLGTFVVNTAVILMRGVFRWKAAPRRADGFRSGSSRSSTSSA